MEENRSSALSSLIPTCSDLTTKLFREDGSTQKKQSSAATYMNICVKPANAHDFSPPKPTSRGSAAAFTDKQLNRASHNFKPARAGEVDV